MQKGNGDLKYEAHMPIFEKKISSQITTLMGNIFFQKKKILLIKTRSDASFSYLQRTEYDQMVKAAAKYLELEPTYLQFFKTQSYREAPGHALR